MIPVRNVNRKLPGKTAQKPQCLIRRKMASLHQYKVARRQNHVTSLSFDLRHERRNI
jgi:hypothetical protein